MLKKKFKDGTHIPSIYFGSQFYTTNACLLYFFIGFIIYTKIHFLYTLLHVLIWGFLFSIFNLMKIVYKQIFKAAATDREVITVSYPLPVDLVSVSSLDLGSKRLK